MEKYIGVKLIEAEPQFKHESTNKDSIEGIEGYKVVYEGGYTSWSPKEVFEKAYRRISCKFLNPFYNYKEDYKNRVCKEASELQEKIFNLRSFINTNVTFKDLEESEKNRLQQQILAMEYYLSILVERINNFEQ
jgi:hypothetical protein